MINSGGRKFYGAKMEMCTVCGEVFNNTRAGDKHRVIVGTYKLVSFNGATMRVNEDQDVMPEGAKVHSIGNQIRRCLSSDEMRRIGMRQEKTGAWNGGGQWIGA